MIINCFREKIRRWLRVPDAKTLSHNILDLTDELDILDDKFTEIDSMVTSNTVEISRLRRAIIKLCDSHVELKDEIDRLLHSEEL